MFTRLFKYLIPSKTHSLSTATRERYGVAAGIVGVVCNLILFAIKLPAGILSGSISIQSDAFNNLSDMGSSITAIIGSKIAAQQPDREHPFGHGRMEYIASLMISFIILFVGLELLISSARSFFNPEPIYTSLLSTIILIVSIVIKLGMYLYNRALGNAIASGVLLATATDSRNDVVITTAVLICSWLDPYINFPIDAVTGTIVSFFILFSGFSIAKDTINQLLGAKADPQLAEKIEQYALEGRNILGMHDLVIHEYGPGRIMASAHVEVPHNIQLVEIHEDIDAIEQQIKQELGVDIVIHCDPMSINDAQAEMARKQLEQVINSIDPRLSTHDFRITHVHQHINLIFDLSVPFEFTAQQRMRTVRHISIEMRDINPKYRCVIRIDDPI